ncbi:Metallo-dependent hydrolase [Imleria badia]|nr:Metallo-dependent hydrolase [Imleria badia]
MPSLPPLDVLRHVVDVHCHPTDSDVTIQAMDNLAITICAMSSRQADQFLVRDLANAYAEKVVPCFGYHPWFSHWISILPGATREEHYRRLFSPSDKHQEMFERLLPHLPDPIPLVDVLAELRRNLSFFPQAMLGEVGLDRAARVPVEYAAEPRELTQFVVPLKHQLAVLEPQIDLAVELRRNVSIHSVKSHQATLDLLSRMHQKHGSEWERISIDLHSCGLSVETWKAIEKRHLNVYMSLSTVINGRSSNHRALIEACSPSRVLVESDYHPVEQCAERTWEMVLVVAEIKGWAVETTWVEDLRVEDWGVVRRLERNWQEFQKGNHAHRTIP